MKITDVRTMLLTGPDPHGVGGIERVWHVLFVRVDTDAGHLRPRRVRQLRAATASSSSTAATG